MRNLVLLISIFLICTASAHTKDSTRNKIIAFTFDDGPKPQFLSLALPFFAAERIKVTFFVVGIKAMNYPHWTIRAFNEGHEIENHTMNHICLAKPSPKWRLCPSISKETAINEVRLAMEVIEKITGYRTRFVRPPHFAITNQRKQEIENALGVRVLIHGRNSIGSLDWVYRDPKKISSQVINSIRKRGDGPYVIVFHENELTLKSLPDTIAFFRSRRYRFVRLDEFVKVALRAEI